MTTAIGHLNLKAIDFWQDFCLTDIFWKINLFSSNKCIWNARTANVIILELFKVARPLTQSQMWTSTTLRAFTYLVRFVSIWFSVPYSTGWTTIRVSMSFSCEPPLPSASRKEEMPHVPTPAACKAKTYISTMRQMNLGHRRPRWCRSFPGASSVQPEERKRGQLWGDNENCLCMCVCVWWALFMKLYCTSNDPRHWRGKFITNFPK